MKSTPVLFASFVCLSAPFFMTGCSSSPSNSGTQSPPSATSPAVTSISPATLAAGSAATTLTVNGTGFLSTTVVQVGGVAEQTTYVSGTQVTAALPATQVASGGLLAVIALNGSLTSGSGAAVNLEVDNPAPTIAQFVPLAIATGSPATSVSVTGTGFVPTTVIQVNGSARSTTYVGATQVNVILTATDLATAGTASLTAFNATPGGGTSPSASVAINNPAPGSITLSPSIVATGATTTTSVTVTGTNFIPSSIVEVAGAARATTYVSATKLTFLLTVADQAAAGHLSVTVVTPTPGGGTTGAATLTVAAPTLTPVIATASPSQFVVGSAASSLIVQGTNLTTTSVVQWNGANLSTSFVTTGFSTYLLASVPANLLASLGTASITVSTPTATPSVSNALTVMITNPPAPTLTAISPAAVPINAATLITLTGTGFTANSTVSLNGTSVTATYVGPTSLTVALPASSVTLPGNNNVTVTTPAPGGGTTAALVFTAYVGIANNSMIYNPANGLFYVSVPSSAGAPYGNSVVSVDPATGALGTPIFVGSEPNKLAITSDGKFLWVGLDGASAVRKVDLTANTAGLQFTLGGNSGIYATPGTALALAALPGATDSVVVSSTNEFSGLVLAIYDSGVVRGTSTGSFSLSSANALQVDGTKSEIYAGGSAYYTYTYSATGLTQKASNTSANFASYSNDEMQIAGGNLYTDSGKVYDPESGSLLGTFYSSGTTVASGTTIADTTLGKVFILDSSATFSTSYNQIQIFNVSDYNPATASIIPVNIATNSNIISNTNPTRLTRWGTNGVAFRNPVGVYSLRSNLIKDLSTVSADLSVTLAASGSNATGSNTTYTATVNNAGPSNATNIAFTALIPSSTVLVSATTSAGICSNSSSVTCDLGGLVSGGSATVTLVVTQTTAGSSSLTVQVSGSETDPNLANNQATSTTTITGSNFNPTPSMLSVSPAAILAGSSDTTITVTGSGFNNTSTILIGSTTLPTTEVSSTKLTAIVPAANLSSLGWTAVSVSTPVPGGGTSTALPLSIYSVITLGVNHIVYDPFSRKIMASVGSGSSAVTGNSIVAITPETATVGTPVPIGSQPTNLALTSDGQVLYTILSGSNSIARYNMLTQQADFSYTVPTNSSFVGGIALRGIAAQPGTENTIALDIASFTGNAIYDFDPVNKTAAIRGQASGPYSGSCIQFLDSADLLAFDTDTSGATLDHYTVTSAGFTYYNYSQYTESTLNHFGCFRLSGGLAFANSGGIANPSTVPATQIGVFPGLSGGTFSTLQDVAPDTSLRRAFFLGYTGTNSNVFSAVDGVVAYDQTTFLPSTIVPLNMATIEGNTSYSGVDLIRWGQDGLAALTSGGHMYILRGAAVVPQLLNQNSAPALTGSSVTTITHGSGNTLLTLTGSNFVPGIAVTWNGSYRTTTIVDATHVSVAIPASDLASAGTGSLVATNPGSSASSSLTVSIN